MTTAKIHVNGMRSMTINGRTVLKGRPATISGEAEIRAWEGQAGVKVVRLAPPTKPKTEQPKANPAPKDESNGNGDEDEDDEDDEPEYTRAQLKGMKKSQLITIAADLGALVAPGEKKSSVIELILEAQDEE